MNEKELGELLKGFWLRWSPRDTLRGAGEGQVDSRQGPQISGVGAAVCLSGS